MLESPDPMAAASAEGGSGAHEPIAEPSLTGIVPQTTVRACTRQFCRGGPENLGLVRGNITIPPHGAVSCRRAKKLPGQHVADSHLNAEGGRPGFG